MEWAPLNEEKYEKWTTDGGNMDEKEIGKFKRRQKDEIIARKTCELTNVSLTLFNEIFLLFENDFKAYARLLNCL